MSDLKKYIKKRKKRDKDFDYISPKEQKIIDEARETSRQGKGVKWRDIKRDYNDEVYNKLDELYEKEKGQKQRVTKKFIDSLKKGKI